MQNCYSSYYQARVKKELCWLVTSTVRFTDHLAFDRCLDKEQSLFEFFVTPGLEIEFEKKMAQLVAKGVAFDLVKLPNRLEQLALENR